MVDSSDEEEFVYTTPPRPTKRIGTPEMPSRPKKRRLKTPDMPPREKKHCETPDMPSREKKHCETPAKMVCAGCPANAPPLTRATTGTPITGVVFFYQCVHDCDTHGVVRAQLPCEQ